MSNYNQNQPQGIYPPPGTAYPAEPQGVPYMAPPPPAGYPMKDGHGQRPIDPAPAETQSRGDGFWKGCCAALCCCCVLEECF